MATKSSEVPNGLRLTVAVVVGIIIAAVGLARHASLIWVLVGWDATALVYLIWDWAIIGGMSPGETARRAVREDPTAAVTDILILTASLASLVAAGVIMASGSSHTALHLAVALPSLAISWVLVHTVFMLRYARLYYGGKPGGINFNQSEEPRYTDFAYLAFTIGMTYQVSDNELQTTAIRATALRQALVSYLYGAVILAGVINLVVGLGSGN